MNSKPRGQMQVRHETTRQQTRHKRGIFTIIELKVNNNNNNNNNKRKNVSSDAGPQQAMETQWSVHISCEK
jgi:hypothetical protein